MRLVLQALLDEIREGRRAALATIVRVSGSTPRTVGARMVVRADGTTFGTIGGGAFEAMVTADAADLLGSAAPAPYVKRYSFSEQGENALGMACGGTAEVLLEVSDAGPRLVIFGAGHVGIALARLAGTVGFACEVVDDRTDLVDAARKAGVARAVVCDEAWSAGVPPIDASCFVAVVTRCHRTDRLALKRAIPGTPRYLGVIGSRRKRAVIFGDLAREDGVSEETLASIRCPIGLPLGGETPEEIAVSIVAELLQVRHA